MSTEVQKENSQDHNARAFHAVSQLFTGAKEVPLELEILRDRNTEIVRDENAVGVPRLLLYAAMSYVLASKHLGSGPDIRRPSLVRTFVP